MTSHTRSSVSGIAVCVLLASSAQASTVQLALVASDLDRPVAVRHAGDGSGRLFFVEQTGRIQVYDAGSLGPEPFLDLSALVSCCGERGLLGLAFHPDYESNGYFYVHFTAASGENVVARFSVSADPNVADPASGSSLLVVPQPGGNHNGGDLAFGPEGNLWISIGDGGSGADPSLPQRGDSLLGKLLRVDVDSAFPYAAPPDNPFVGDGSTRDEIWALGFRNPWRFSFDRLTGALFVGDVGQNLWEEIDYEPATSNGGKNYGWRFMEGNHCFQPASGCNDGSLTLPVVEYSHAEGCSVTGGYRYRGAAMPEHFGTYVFGDFCSGRIWGAREQADGSWTSVELLDSSLSISGFGEDETGEIYLTDISGSVFRLEATTACSVEPNQSSYTTGDTVRAESFRVSHVGESDVAVELKAWLSVPGSSALPLVNAGADGSVVLAPGFFVDVGPLDLFTIGGPFPPGNYEIGCRLLNPTTGALVGERLAPFRVE